MKRVKELDLPVDYIKPEIMFKRRFQVHIPTREDWKKGPEPMEDDDIHCYTDGSKKEEKVGAGFLVSGNAEKWEESIPLGKHVTVQQAEVFAINKAARKLISQNIRNKKVTIFSDNQAGLMALKQPKIKSGLIKECVSVLNNLGTKNKVVLKWVPGHSGIEGNENADNLAKKALEIEYYGPEPALPVSEVGMKQKVNRYVHRQHCRRWSCLPGLRQSKKMIKRPNSKSETTEMINLTRRELRLVVGIKTGHCILNKHLSILKVVESARCSRCNTEDETPYHHCGICPAYGFKRLMYFGKARLTEEEFTGLSVRQLLSFLKSTGRLEVKE